MSRWPVVSTVLVSPAHLNFQVSMCLIGHVDLI